MNDKIVELARRYQVPADEKMNRRLDRLSRMTAFYESKIPDAPEKQANMFKGFVSSLLYAATMIKMYRKLTKELNTIAEEATNESTESTDA
jgi:hypothetical protein